jgi:imidazolonepropionase-like amidohydrolase
MPRPAYDRTLEGVIASPRSLLPATREVEIERMLALSKELKLNAVLYGGHEAWRAADLLKQSGTPVLIGLKYPERAPDSDPALDEPLRVLELREKAPSAAGALAKAGVKFAFYSGGLNTKNEIMRAVRMAIDAGLDPAAALRGLTLSAAEIYNVSDRVGSIEKGKIANLVITDSDLFAEKTKVKYVFVDGVKFEPPDVPASATPGGRGGRGPGGPVQ